MSLVGHPLYLFDCLKLFNNCPGHISGGSYVPYYEAIGAFDEAVYAPPKATPTTSFAIDVKDQLAALEGQFDSKLTDVLKAIGGLADTLSKVVEAKVEEAVEKALIRERSRLLFGKLS